jgi:hypothetical protein
MSSRAAPIIATLILTSMAHPYRIHTNYDYGKLNACTGLVAGNIEPTDPPLLNTTNTTAFNPDTVKSASMDASSVLGSGYQTSDLTYYILGLSACGKDDTGRDMTDNIVAMSSEVMGPESNTNPTCGRSIKIYNQENGKSSTGVVQDKCPGCKRGSIDVSQKLFQGLGDLSQGRITISWNWIS